MKRSRFDRDAEGKETNKGAEPTGTGTGRSDGELSRKKQKKRSRWETVDDSDKTLLEALPTKMPPNLTPEQQEQFLMQLPIIEITERLRRGELGIPRDPAARSPSPEPVYGQDGKRVNTREFRARKRLDEERHALIAKLLKVNPNYRPPADYKPPKYTEKVFIPREDHPEINFVGLLLGPRGHTLKELTQSTGATIVIRGKGSVKEGKVDFKDGKVLPGQDEPLHAYVTSGDYDSVRLACDRIRKIIRDGIDVPDTENELRREQLRALAVLNGTIREGDALARLRQAVEVQTIVTNRIVCTNCGGAGHIAGDCRQARTDGQSTDEAGAAEENGDEGGSNQRAAKMDSEYLSLMAELGVELPSGVAAAAAASNATSAPPTQATTHSTQATSSFYPAPPTATVPGWQTYPPMWGYPMPGAAPWFPMSTPMAPMYGACPWYGAVPPFYDQQLPMPPAPSGDASFGRSTPTPPLLPPRPPSLPPPPPHSLPPPPPPASYSP